MDHLVVDDGLAKPVGRLPDPGFVLADHGSDARLQFFDVLKHNGGILVYYRYGQLVLLN